MGSLVGGMWPEGPYAIAYVSSNGNDTNDGFSWAQAKRSVQGGIDAVTPSGGDVWVAAGRYPERVTLPAYVYLYGGFQGSEINRGERDWMANQAVLDGPAQDDRVHCPIQPRLRRDSARRRPDTSTHFDASVRHHRVSHARSM